MKADFDIAAHTYDAVFTNTQIGILQRQRVWRLLDKALKNSSRLKVLELNCGTGEDANRMAQKGHTVVATDISEEMLSIAKSKSDSSLISYSRLDLNDIAKIDLDTDFDLVFSNFGGLNCIDEESMINLGSSLAQILKPNGKFFAVIMPKVCLWEIVFLMLKGKNSEAFRRNRDFAEVNVSGKLVKTWYYNPNGFSNLLGKKFRRVNLRPIGLFIPPSYMEPFFRRNKRLLKVLNTLEKVFANFSWQARFSDHYYIEYSVK